MYLCPLEEDSILNSEPLGGYGYTGDLQKNATAVDAHREEWRRARVGPDRHAETRGGTLRHRASRLDCRGATEDCRQPEAPGGVLRTAAATDPRTGRRRASAAEGARHPYGGALLRRDGRAPHVGGLQGDGLALGRVQRQEQEHLLLGLSAAVARVVRGACGGSRDVSSAGAQP